MIPLVATNGETDGHAQDKNRMKNFLIYSIIIITFAESIRFTFLYSKIESHVIMLVASNKAFDSKSGSSLHDSAMSVIFNSNLHSLKARKDTLDGAIAYFLVLYSNDSRRDSFKLIEATYLAR